MRRLILSALTLCLASLSVLSAASGATTPPPFATSEFSTSVVAENNLPGTTAWHLGATPKGTYVEGFFNKDYVAAGDATSFYVSTNATTYRLAAYRMGWYHGAGGRLVWTSPVESGRVQPACPLNATVNMVSCTNWSAGGSVAITSDFVPGDYVFKLTASNGAQSYMLLTVWNPTSTATYVLIGRTMTDEGWNTFGGYDFYRGVGTCAKGAASYPPCNRARVVSLDRPYATGHGSSDFFGNEYPLVSFVEEHGLDVTYVTDVTLNDHPAFALHHKAILSLGHDETWSYPERAGVLQAFHQGTNLVFFGSAAVLRHARMQASAFGPSREVVDYRDSYADPLLGHGNPMDVTGNTFAQYPTGLPPTQLTGELYSGYTVRGHFSPTWSPTRGPGSTTGCR